MSPSARTSIQAAINDGRSITELESARLVLGDGGSDEDAAAWLYAWAYEAIRPVQAAPKVNA